MAAFTQVGSNANVFTTIDYVKHTTGSYTIDHGIPASLSANALTGKYLRRHRRELGIAYCGRKTARVAGKRTTTAIWRGAIPGMPGRVTAQ